MISVPLNLRGIIAISVTMVILTIAFIYMNSKEKSEYENSIGQITYLDRQLGELPVRNIGKYRYLMIATYDYPFEIFVGNESGDFKPKFEQIDNLKVGDTVSVFYYQTENTMMEGINRFIQFVDKDDKSFYERGSSNRTLGIVLILLSVLLATGGLILWKTNRIKY